MARLIEAAEAGRPARKTSSARGATSAWVVSNRSTRPRPRLSRDAELAKVRHGLHLPSLSTIDASALQALQSSEYLDVTIEGLSELSPEAAYLLVKETRSSLELPGFTELSPEVAAALARFEGDYIELKGLEHLSPAAALALCS
ncbi:MAG: hypothetical protein HN348_24900 [Proteobacteria bacterium]|jgi:hypothetical protein|nr:hypothetical protein [Pseudomonadota bacterium]